ncbi:MAG: hypothetical protein R6U98_22320 [Pirellulaceae bacterium]
MTKPLRFPSGTGPTSIDDWRSAAMVGGLETLFDAAGGGSAKFRSCSQSVFSIQGSEENPSTGTVLEAGKERQKAALEFPRRFQHVAERTLALRLNRARER